MKRGTTIMSALLILGLVFASVAIINAAAEEEISPEESFPQVYVLNKGELVFWDWNSTEYGLDFQIIDPENDTFYSSTDMMGDEGNFTTTITGNWTFVWVNPNELQQTIDFTTMLNYTINITNQAPTANIDADPVTGIGELSVTFNGTGLDVDGEIVEYLWDFGDGTTSNMSYMVHNYTAPGTYEVNLTVTDDDGATGYTLVTITVLPETPLFVGSSVDDGATDLALDTKVMLEFSLSMDKSDVESKMAIDPAVTMSFVWSEMDKKVEVSFDALGYSTTYELTLMAANATNGGVLGADVSVTFSTMEEPKSPEVAITSPAPDEKFKKGDTITVEGTAVDIDEGEKISVKVGEETKEATVGADGKWTIEFEAPEDGEYSITVTYEDISEDIGIMVEKEDDDENYLIYIIIAVAVIVLIIIIFLVLARKKDDETPEEDLEDQPMDDEDDMEEGSLDSYDEDNYYVDESSEEGEM